MNYKVRLVLLFLGIFFLVLSATLAFVYVSYADFRKEEYWERLRHKSIVTANLLLEVKEIDKGLLKLIDRNSITRMYDEKVLVFDEENTLIYSSLDDEPLRYTPALLNQVRAENELFYTDEDGDEVVGINYKGEGKDYVVLASAFDKWGKRKMQNLLQDMLLALGAGLLLILGSSYFYIRQVFQPIDRLNQSMRNISEKNLKQYLPVRNSRDELDQLAINYNQMQERLHQAFELQRSFVHNASHELKTPLARMNHKVEKALREQISHPEVLKMNLSSLLQDISWQAELIEGLLLLHRLGSPSTISHSVIRIDELLFKSMEKAHFLHNELLININMEESIVSEEQLSVRGNPILIETCFQNLLNNAAAYAPDKKVNISILGGEQWVELIFSNKGVKALSDKYLFEPFFRDENASHTVGSGLGLSIIRKIAENMGGKAIYTFLEGTHHFTLHLPVKI